MNSATALTSIVVVCHDSGEVLLRCVEQALAQSVPVEVIVIDNASSDGVPQRLPSDLRLRLVRNGGNPGFAVACNQGAALGQGEYLLFLNPDCLLEPDSVARLRAHFATDAGIAVLGAQLLNTDGSAQGAARRRTPTPLRAIRRALGQREVEMAPPAVAVEGIEYVEAVSGALMLMPRRAFDELGGFDEGYVLHCEDLDLCRRVLAAGRRIAVAPDVRVVHLKGTSSRHRPIWVEWQKHRGMLRYFRKFDAAASPWWLRIAVPVGVWLRFPLAAVRALLR